MSRLEANDLESDARFPSGPWLGYFLQPQLRGRHYMELRLKFQQGQMTGEGRDWVGEFLIRGRYSLADGKCRWTKRYLGKHDVYYQGYNEGKGIWGVWEIPPSAVSPTGWRGGFHIWPEGMPDPSKPHLVEQAELPADVDDRVKTAKEIGAPA